MDDVPHRIEHTVLGPTTTWDDVTTVLDDALEYGMRACVPSCYVEQAVEYAPGVDVTTVIGFPHGQQPVETKCQEAVYAWDAGAAEVDVVPNLGTVPAEAYDALAEELMEVTAAVPIPVKVIVESPLFEAEQLRQVGEAAVEADVDFLKTSTGFTEGGATVDDVALLSEYRDVKASGGVGSWLFARELFDAGATRIGASSGVKIVEEYYESDVD
jgi:deoxyribose-phosphate aldolase